VGGWCDAQIKTSDYYLKGTENFFCLLAEKATNRRQADNNLYFAALRKKEMRCNKLKKFSALFLFTLWQRMNF
jgi:hypothetical protein